MPNDALPSLHDLVEDRLEEWLFGGHITQQAYQEALLGHPLPVNYMKDYLETCLKLPCIR